MQTKRSTWAEVVIENDIRDHDVSNGSMWLTCENNSKIWIISIENSSELNDECRTIRPSHRDTNIHFSGIHTWSFVHISSVELAKNQASFDNWQGRCCWFLVLQVLWFIVHLIVLNSVLTSKLFPTECHKTRKVLRSSFQSGATKSGRSIVNTFRNGAMWFLHYIWITQFLSTSTDFKLCIIGREPMQKFR